MSTKQAGVLIWKRIPYKPVLAAKPLAPDDPALAYGDG